MMRDLNHHIGLVIGKFIPLHKGHVALIQYAQSICATLKIALVCHEEDAIDPSIRAQWIRQSLLPCEANVDIRILGNELPRTQGYTEEAFQTWVSFFKEAYPEVTLIVSSEAYGESLASLMAIDHQYFDPNRDQFPISGSSIMSDPEAYVEWLPDYVKSYFNSGL